MSKIPRILVVDDEETIRLAIETALEDTGWDITGVGTGAEAVAAAAQAPFDVMILDKNLPDTTGVEVLKTIREHDNDSRVIMLTGYANIESAVEMAMLGIDTYLEKPLKDIFQIAKIVGTALTKKKLADARIPASRGTSQSLTANDQALNFLLRTAVVGLPSDDRRSLALALKEMDLSPVVADSLEEIGIALQAANLVFLCDPDPLVLTRETREQFPDHQIVVVCENPGLKLARDLIDVGLTGIIKGKVDSPGSRDVLRQIVAAAVKKL